MRLLAMRNEDYDRELLAAVTFVCSLLALIVSTFDAAPSAARSAGPVATLAASASAPVRIVGTPFVPNTNPSVR